MSDDKRPDGEPTPQQPAAAAPKAVRPTGKRQLAGAATLTPNSAAKPIVQVSEGDSSSQRGSSVASFLPEVVAEMKKVVWPTHKEMVQYTLITFAFLIVLTALVWSVDALTGLGVEWVLTP